MVRPVHRRRRGPAARHGRRALGRRRAAPAARSRSTARWSAPATSPTSARSRGCSRRSPSPVAPTGVSTSAPAARTPSARSSTPWRPPPARDPATRVTPAAEVEPADTWADTACSAPVGRLRAARPTCPTSCGARWRRRLARVSGRGPGGRRMSAGSSRSRCWSPPSPPPWPPASGPGCARPTAARRRSTSRSTCSPRCRCGRTAASTSPTSWPRGGGATSTTPTLPVQTEVLDGGRQVSPHDPLLPLLLAAPMGLGGWLAAKLALAVLAGGVAALTVWVAVRRFGVAALAGRGRHRRRDGLAAAGGLRTAGLPRAARPPVPCWSRSPPPPDRSARRGLLAVGSGRRRPCRGCR